MSARRVQRIAATLALGGPLALGAPAEADLLGAATSEGHRLSATVYRQGAALRIDGPSGAVSQEVDEEWSVRVSPGGALIGLLRDSRTGTQLRLLDATGGPVSERFFPIEEQPLLTDRGIVSLPHPGDQVLTRHWLRFYASDGQLVGEANEPELTISRFQVMAGGRVLTASSPSSEGQVTFVVYDERGGELFRHAVAAAGGERIVRIDASPDGRRLFYLQGRQGAREARSGMRLSIVGEAGQLLARHALSHVSQLAISAASDRLAVVGAGSLALFDATSGGLIWQVRARFDAPAVNGLRFSERGDELFVLTSRIDATGESARAYLYRARLGDGRLEIQEIGEHSTHEGLTLLGASSDDAGRLRLVLPRREVVIEASSGDGGVQ